MVPLIIVFLSVMSTLHGNPIDKIDQESLIVGGEVVDIKDFAYMVSIEFFEYHRCGGSILNRFYILTAAHCFIGFSGLEPYLRVRTGSSTMISGGKLYSVQKILNHENYNQKAHTNDISLLKLRCAIEFNVFTKPILLPSPQYEPKSNEIGVVSGFGRTKENGDLSYKLRAVAVPIFDHKTCKESYKEVNDKMICAGFKQGEKDACQGDSGGPLVSGSTVVGIVSFGKGCARPDKPGVYTKVGSFIKWIVIQMQINTIL